jgi:probable F420-dependent oxidoreductase
LGAALQGLASLKEKHVMTSYHSFRFGVEACHARSGKDWAEKARKLEDLGYATLFVSDHFDDQLAPVPALMAAAATTTCLRVSSFVFDNDYRHPVVLAKEAATLDLLSDGRFELGLGAGYLRSEYEQAGLPFDPSGVRINRLAEAIRVMKGLFADEPCAFSGTYYTVTSLNGLPKPIQRPHPPLFLGGSGQRMLSLAGHEANIVSLAVNDVADATAEASLQKLAWIRQAAGGRFDELELHSSVFIIQVTDHRQQMIEETAHRLGLSTGQITQSPHMLIGTLDQIVEDLQRRREQFAISYIGVEEKDLDTFSPVVARLAGM